jgi:hypothetical protein
MEQWSYGVMELWSVAPFPDCPASGELKVLFLRLPFPGTMADRQGDYRGRYRWAVLVHYFLMRPMQN